MRLTVLSALFLLGCGLSGHQAVAQQGPVEPLPLVKSVVVGVAPIPEARVATAPPTRPAAPVASQPPAAPPRKMAEPLYTLGQRVVVGNSFLRNLNPDRIQAVQVYKGVDAPAPLRGLTENGIIDITLKKRVHLPAKSLVQLAHQLRVRHNVSYLVNGMPLTNSKLRIATESIQEIKVARSAAGTTLSVWLFQPPAVPLAPPKTYPSGPIMIRGTASR